jgi:hypothetical protein
MKMRRIVGYARVLATLFLSGLAQSAAPNTITFDNQSGTDAIVKMVGRTRGAVPVPNRSRASIQVEPGSYYILVRYGSAGHYSYSKGEKFSVESHSDSYTAVLITLHKVVNGNYASWLASQAEFNQE